MNLKLNLQVQQRPFCMRDMVMSQPIRICVSDAVRDFFCRNGNEIDVEPNSQRHLHPSTLALFVKFLRTTDVCTDGVEIRRMISEMHCVLDGGLMDVGKMRLSSLRTVETTSHIMDETQKSIEDLLWVIIEDGINLYVSQTT